MAYHRKPSRWARRGPREAFTPGERRTILVRDGCFCYLCGGPAGEVDHVIPLAEGGAHSLDNACAICAGCHETKSREEAERGYERRLAMRKLPPEPHPFDMES